MNQREIIDTLRLDPDAGLKDCVLARNRLVRRNMKKEMRQMLQDMQRGEEDNDFSWLSCKVFCVATKAYTTILGAEQGVEVCDLNLNDTEVPSLVHEIQT